jgi:hypothetical protein
VSSLANSIAVQDQEWSEARAWMTHPDNASAAAALTVASVAEDATDLTLLMMQDERYAEVVQRMVALVIVEVLHRTQGVD